jgi:hypothetical protein
MTGFGMEGDRAKEQRCWLSLPHLKPFDPEATFKEVVSTPAA